MTAEVVTFGCRLNAYESELIKKSAAEAGTENTIIFNSCAVTSEAERQLKQSIRRAHRENPDKKIIVTGCAAQINPEKYAKMEGVTKVIGNIEKTEAKSYMDTETEQVLVNDIMSVEETAFQFIDGMANKSRAFLQIQNGCNHRCTFCIIPYGRGNSRTTPVGEIAKQVQILVEKGYNEVVLTGVDVTDYGLDLPGKPTLGQMVKRVLAAVPELKRIRLSSIDVAEIDKDLMQLIISEPRFMPHLHLSLQAGDNMILKRMKRRHTREQVIQFCDYVTSKRPEITFGADIIAGFPTETDEMFAQSVAIIKEAGLKFLHIFPYSEREGTPAARMPQVPKDVRKARAKVLRELGQAQVADHNKNIVGKRVRVISEGTGMARAEDFTLVKVDADLKPGEIYEVEITGAEAKFALGRLV